MSEWRDFEIHIYPNVRRRFPAHEGWMISEKKQISGNYIADYVAYRGNERAIIDAKDKIYLTYSDIEQVLDYGGQYKATHIIIYIAHDTIVPKNVRQYAKINEIKIQRTLWRTN